MPKVNRFIFRAYDIRGIAIDEKNEPDLTPTTIKLIGKAASTYLQEHFGKNIAVGRDNRITSETLQKAFIEGLLETGCNVTNVGLATSPMMYWTTCALEFDAAINITASHNPKEYNGIKITAKNGHSICGDELQKIYKLIEDEKFASGQGKLSTKEIEDLYINDLLSRAKLHRPMHIVVDCGNGVAGLFAEKLFTKFGCKVTPLYCDLDGNFPNHEANPESAENLKECSKKIPQVGADLGFGFDGDGDRIGILDEKGNHYSADLILLLLARDLLSRMPGSKIVFDVKASQTLINDIRDHGGIPVMCKTGHSFIENKMHEIKAPLGGEISGHFFFAENYYGFDDAFLAGLRFLDYLSRQEKPLSEIMSEIPKMFTTPEYKVHCPDDRKFQIVQEVADELCQKYSCITIDGVRANIDTSTWGAVRCSNTSPNLTLRFESSKPEKLQKVKQIFFDALKKYPEVDRYWFEKS